MTTDRKRKLIDALTTNYTSSVAKKLRITPTDTNSFMTVTNNFDQFVQNSCARIAQDVHIPDDVRQLLNEDTATFSQFVLWKQYNQLCQVPASINNNYQLPSALHASLVNTEDESLACALTNKSTVFGRPKAPVAAHVHLSTMCKPETSLSAISKQHFAIVYDDSKSHFLLVNYSKNGTFVDGYHVIHDPMVLHDGTLIQVIPNHNSNASDDDNTIPMIGMHFKLAKSE